MWFATFEQVASVAELANWGSSGISDVDFGVDVLWVTAGQRLVSEYAGGFRSLRDTNQPTRGRPSV